MKLFFISILMLSSFKTFADTTTHLMLIGGGGEDSGKNDTIFDSSVGKFGEYYKKATWGQTDVSFNGGHKATEQILSTDFKNAPNKPFTNDQFALLIKKYSDLMNNGTIKPGDQLMIYIDSHGAINFGNQSTHSISTSGSTISDYNTLAGNTLVDLDLLKTLTDLAKTKKVKLAIVDMSCHSGNSLKLSNDYTCVISATGPNHFGYGGADGTFGFEFSRNLAKGANLEDVFLAARKNTTDKSYPMISTPQNAAISEFEYNNISPYLYYYDSTADKLSPYIMNSASSGVSCVREDGFRKLNELIKRIEELNTVKKKMLFTSYTEKQIDLSVLKTSLAEYKKIQDDMIASMQKLHVKNLNNVEEITSTVSENKTYITDKFKWSEILTSDYLKAIENANTKITANVNVEYNKNLVSFYTNAQAKKEKIIRENPELTEINSVVKSFDEKVKGTMGLASTIANEEKKLYNALYKGQAHKYEGKTNACKNFVL